MFQNGEEVKMATVNDKSVQQEIPLAEASSGTISKKPISEPLAFRKRSETIAMNLLETWVGEERARESAGRISVALAASASMSRNPKDFYDCTPDSVGRVIAVSALTGIMPSTGAVALAYAIPRRPRKGEAPQLQYQLSHRGINALANRAGMHMVAIPISFNDVIETTETGDVVVKSRDLDNPPTNEDELRGVIVQVKRLDGGGLVCSGWVPKKVILERRKMSDGFNYAERPGNEYAKDTDPWHRWYVEQAMKTALHYAIGRGWCVIDDTEAVRALSHDAESDIIDGEVVRPQGKLVAKIQEDLL